MAYIINKTDGSLLAVIADGTVDSTSCSVSLFGKNYTGYGTLFNDNLVHILENFADSVSPTAPLEGQLWWDTTGNLKVYNGTSFSTISSIGIVANSAPSGSVTGNFWFDTYSKRLNVYDGASWVLVGQAWSSSEDLANGAAANLAVVASYFTTGAAETATLAAGTNGQVKTFMMSGDGGDMVITVTNPGWGGAGTMTFNDVGDGCTLQYINNKWYCIGNNGVVFA